MTAARFARIGVWTGTEDELDRWVEAAKADVKPNIAQQTGTKGALFLCDRRRVKALTITLWESEEARDASEAFRSQSQGRSASASGASVTTERYEIVDSFFA